MECWTRKPVNTSIDPSSILTGKCTMSSRAGYRRTVQSPSSRFSFCAAKSNRAAWASQGLISCSRVSVCIACLQCSSERCAALCEQTSMKHAENRRKCYEWVVLVPLMPRRFRRDIEHPHWPGQTHEYRLAADTSTTKGVSDFGTPLGDAGMQGRECLPARRGWRHAASPFAPMYHEHVPETRNHDPYLD